MMLVLAVIAFAVFLVLSGLHVYWAIGGRWGLDAALPELNGERVLTPSPWATWLVAVALLAAAFTVLGRASLWQPALPPWLFYWGTWALAALFLLRALGEFKLVGFFKRVKNTTFAHWDTMLFSPLCLVMAAVLSLVARS